MRSRLVSELSKVRKEIADFFLAGVDDLAGRSRVDGGGHLMAKLLEAFTQLLEQSVSGNGRFGSHGRVLSGRENEIASPSSYDELPLSLRTPERFTTPPRLRVSG